MADFNQTCTYPTCERRGVVAIGFCLLHYRRTVSNGSPEVGFSGPRPGVVEYQLTPDQLRELSEAGIKLPVLQKPRPLRPVPSSKGLMTAAPVQPKTGGPAWQGHGMDYTRFQDLLTACRATCQICFVAPVHVVDHDHSCCGLASCGKCVRGLLCRSCNGVIGGTRDSIGALRAMAAEPTERRQLFESAISYYQHYEALKAVGERVTGSSWIAHIERSEELQAAEEERLGRARLRRAARDVVKRGKLSAIHSGIDEDELRVEVQKLRSILGLPATTLTSS
jgi:hypothetical protein